jgi:nucleoside-diphosphate-sugar epimerase
VGRHVLPLLLERGWEVHAVTSRHMPAVPSPRALPDAADVCWHHGDLLDHGTPARLINDIRPDALVHLAWYIAPGRWAQAPENLAWVSASLELAHAFAMAGGTRFIGAGSCLEYDWQYGYCGETRTPCAPHTLYGTAKHALRLLVEGLAAQTRVSVAWGRIFFLYGPGEHPDRLVASIFRSILAEERARCSHGRQVRDYLFVGDVADAFVRLLESNVRGPINIASGVPITLRALATRAAEMAGRPDLLDFGAVPAAPTDTPLVVADVAKLNAELSWSPAWDLDRGLDVTLAWWRRVIEQGAAAR